MNNTEYQSSVPQSISKRGEKTAVGVIRWDYWGTAPSQDRYIQNLNKPELWWRLPWWAKVDQENKKVMVPDYTQEIVDSEIEYAQNAGIDYFAFLLYNAPSDKAFKFYLSSTKKRGVKWAAILGLSGWDMGKMEWLAEQIYKPDYQTVQDGRPLIYAQGAWATTIRKLCKTKEKQPYIVSLLHAEDIEDAKANDVDAVSVYTQFGSGEVGSEYANIVKFAASKWDEKKALGVQTIPNVTAGWDPRPRFQNGDDASGKAWNQNAEAEEIVQNLKNRFAWMEENKEFTLANTLLMYAWNEHDEGGWICPTYDPQNPSVPDTKRLDAMKNLLNP